MDMVWAQPGRGFGLREDWFIREASEMEEAGKIPSVKRVVGQNFYSLWLPCGRCREDDRKHVTYLAKRNN